MFDAEPMPCVIGQRVVEDEVFQRNTDLPDIVQERGDGERRFRDTLSLELGSEEIADRMRAFELAFDDLIRADAVMEGLGVEQLEQGEHFPVCRGEGGNDIGEFFPDAGVGLETENLFLEERAIFPELYSAPKGWYGTHYVARLSKELPEDTLRQMHGYYEKLLRKYPDVVTVKDVVTLTGYTLTTVHSWCSRGSLKAFQK